MNERQKIATDNIKLVYHFANQFKSYCEKEGVTIEDLISIGTIGLMRQRQNCRKLIKVYIVAKRILVQSLRG
jgi:DNA-directed RNA polymerase specialized sigma subunit